MNTPAAAPHPVPLTHATRGAPWPLWAMAALVVLTLAVVAWQRLQTGPAAPEVVPALWQRSLHFEDRTNGDVAVLDAKDRAEIARFSGEQGFLRGSLRVLTRERARRGIGAEQPFLLSGHAQGRMTLSDPATGERIPLDSFGPSNAAVFAPLRDASASRQP